MTVLDDATANAARMGARAGKSYMRTGVSGPTPFDTSPDAPPRLRALTVAYCKAYVAELPKPATRTG